MNDQTLISNLDQLYINNPGLAKPDFTNLTGEELIALQHDSQHVIFGCKTDVEGETALQISIFLLSDLTPVQIYKMYTSGQEELAKEYFDELMTHARSLTLINKFKITLRLIAHFAKCLWTKLTTSSRFPFTRTHEFLTWKVQDIRNSYKIQSYDKV
jgi:ABC-type Fe2+-enterobactin transport system substrate-binding protein